MASLSESEVTNRGSMWQLDQNLDQPMDEEAGRLKNMYREKGLSFPACQLCGTFLASLSMGNFAVSEGSRTN
jgi:hypothetical protein